MVVKRWDFFPLTLSSKHSEGLKFWDLQKSVSRTYYHEQVSLNRLDEGAALCHQECDSSYLRTLSSASRVTVSSQGDPPSLSSSPLLANAQRQKPWLPALLWSNSVQPGNPRSPCGTLLSAFSYPLLVSDIVLRSQSLVNLLPKK